jgi:ABC-type glycerol-3-phosphate transport system permease component
MSRKARMTLHGVILLFAAATLLPFVFVFNNSFRSNTERYRAFFGLPNALKAAAPLAVPAATDAPGSITVVDDLGESHDLTPRGAFIFHLADATKGYRYAWTSVRPYMINSIFVSASASSDRNRSSTSSSAR